MPAILLVQQTYSLTTVFVCLATLLVIAAGSVNLLGPEASRGASTILPRRPTLFVDVGNSFWLKFARRSVAAPVRELVAVFLPRGQQVASTLPCFLYTTDQCQAWSPRRSGRQVRVQALPFLDRDCPRHCRLRRRSDA